MAWEVARVVKHCSKEVASAIIKYGSRRRVNAVSIGEVYNTARAWFRPV